MIWEVPSKKMVVIFPKKIRGVTSDTFSDQTIHFKAGILTTKSLVVKDVLGFLYPEQLMFDDPILKETIFCLFSQLVIFCGFGPFFTTIWGIWLKLFPTTLSKSKINRCYFQWVGKKHIFFNQELFPNSSTVEG